MHLAERLRSSRHSAAHWFAYKLRSELRAADSLTPLVIDGVGFALLAEFVRAPGIRVDRVAPTWLERARAQLHDEFIKPPSLQILADAAGVHRVHFARAFRKHYACTVGEYVRLRRIEYAAHRLTTSDALLSDVALGSGFSDQSHFTTVFKRLIGITPGEFRSRTSPQTDSATRSQADVTGRQDIPPATA
jgi:AraC family transcriptional regulator